MSEPISDQMPESWSDGAADYDENFAGYTAMYAEEMLDALGVGAGSDVVDIAAGTGATSLRAAARGAAVTAVDFSPGMVDVVARRLRDEGHSSAVARVMDGQALDLADDSFDAAVSMFGLMFFPDAASGVAEARRVVRPGGRFGTATWDLVGFPMHRLIRGAVERAMPGVELPAPPPPSWAELGTSDGLRSLLAGADLNDVEVREVVRPWHFRDPERFFLDMPGWSSPVRPLFEGLPPDTLAAAAVAFAEIVGESGGLPDGTGIPMVALFGTATVPAD